MKEITLASGTPEDLEAQVVALEQLGFVRVETEPSKAEELYYEMTRTIYFQNLRLPS